MNNKTLNTTMQKIQYIKSYNNKRVGDADAVCNNVAHGLIEAGVAILYRNRMFRAPMDKMMRTEAVEPIELPKKRRRKKYRIK